MKQVKIILLLVGMILLIGCAHLQPQPTFKYISWQTRQAKLQQNKNWAIYGSLSVTHNKKRDTARFEWENNQGNYIINVMGPMNLNRIKIIGRTNKIEFCQSGNKCTQAKSPEQLFFDKFGWQLPISNIQYWIRTLPAPTKIKKTNFDQYGHLVELEQNGWRVNYSEFQSIKNIDLPTIIELKNSAFLIKLKITKILL